MVCNQFKCLTTFLESHAVKIPFAHSLVAETYPLGEDLGVRQVLSPEPSMSEEAAKAILMGARHYMADNRRKELPSGILDLCRNKNERCAAWAAAGRCHANSVCKLVKSLQKHVDGCW